MAWIYEISEHTLEDLSTPLGTCASINVYSGAFGVWQNNPLLPGVVDHSPIPQGNWIGTALVNDPETGEDTIVLAPADEATRAHVISLGHDPDSYRIHGERIPPAPPGYASKGCIVAPYAVRMAFWESPDKRLQVTA